MNTIPCDIIRDLMPSYVDGLCSEATKNAVEAHAADCVDCGSAIEAMQAYIRLRPTKDDIEEKKIEGISKFLKRIKVKALIIGLLAASVVFAAGIFVHGAFNWKNTLVPQELVRIEAYMLKNGDIACVYHYPGKDGGAQFGSTRRNDGPLYTYLEEPLIVLDPVEKTEADIYELNGFSGDDSKINEIYYGNPDGNGKLIWREGMALPPAPEALEREAERQRQRHEEREAERQQQRHER